MTRNSAELAIGNTGSQRHLNLEIEMEFALVICSVILGILIGNTMGDHATLKNCAMHGQASMIGGGTVKCEVIREDVK